MKNLMYFTLALGTLLLSSCRKESNGLTSSKETFQNINPTEYEYKYSKEITIYDKSGTSFLTLQLQSDDEETVNQAYIQYKKSTLELIYESPKQEKNNEANKNSEFVNPIFDNNSLMVKYVNSYTGDANGYSFNMANNNKVLFGGFNLASYSGFTCNMLKTELVTGNNVTCSYYYNDSGWVFENSSVMTNGSFSYSGSTYAQKMVQLYKAATYVAGDVVVYF